MVKSAFEIGLNWFFIILGVFNILAALIGIFIGGMKLLFLGMLLLGISMMGLGIKWVSHGKDEDEDLIDNIVFSFLYEVSNSEKVREKVINNYKNKWKGITMVDIFFNVYIRVSQFIKVCENFSERIILESS